MKVLVTLGHHTANMDGLLVAPAQLEELFLLGENGTAPLLVFEIANKKT